MPTRRGRGEVLPTSEARAHQTSITAEFREKGAACDPVIFGSHRAPKAALVPYELVELLDPILDDVVLAARVRERLAADEGERVSFDEVAARWGVELDCSWRAVRVAR